MLSLESWLIKLDRNKNLPVKQMEDLDNVYSGEGIRLRWSKHTLLEYFKIDSQIFLV